MTPEWVRWKGCIRKRRFPSRRAAERPVRFIYHHSRTVMRSYFCEQCGGFHLTFSHQERKHVRRPLDKRKLYQYNKGAGSEKEAELMETATVDATEPNETEGTLYVPMTDDHRKIVNRLYNFHDWYKQCPITLFINEYNARMEKEQSENFKRTDRLSPPKFAILAGISYPTVRNWMNGHTKPGPMHMGDLAKVFGVKYLEMEQIWANWYKDKPR